MTQRACPAYGTVRLEQIIWLDFGCGRISSSHADWDSWPSVVKWSDAFCIMLTSNPGRFSGTFKFVFRTYSHDKAGTGLKAFSNAATALANVLDNENCCCLHFLVRVVALGV